MPATGAARVSSISALRIGRRAVLDEAAARV
jgi:hypothetical protein